MPKELEALLAQTDTLTKKAQGAVLSATLDIRKEIAYLASKLNIAGSADAREAVFAEISKKLVKLGQRLNKLFEANDNSAAKHGAAQASKATGVAVKMSKAHTDAIVDTLRQTGGKGGENLAATMTNAMDKNIVTALRNATVSAFREQAVGGLTMKELEKVLRQKWEAVADDPKNLQFVDKSGRVWDTDTYINMQTRTNAARIYNDSLVESIGKATGSDLVMVSRGGDPDCKLCFPWEGRILSITGKTKGFPTYEEARAAGLFHPNCVHTLEPVDEELDADEIRLQSKFKPPEGLQPSDMDEQRYQIDIQRKIQEQGLSATEAKTAVDRDNLTTALRMGLITDDAQKVVNGLSDEQVNALCPDGNPPSFAPVKDNPTHEAVWNKGSAGGNLFINPKDLTADKLVEVADIGTGKPLEQIEAPVLFIGNTGKVDEALTALQKGMNDCKALIDEVKAHRKAVQTIKNKTQMLFVRAGVDGKEYLKGFDNIFNRLTEVDMEAHNYFGDFQGGVDLLPTATPETAEQQAEADEKATSQIDYVSVVAPEIQTFRDKLAAGDYDSDAQALYDNAQGAIDSKIAEKVAKAVEHCRAIRTEITGKAAKRREYAKQIAALASTLTAGGKTVKMGALTIAFNDISSNMAEIEGKVKIAAMNAITAFNGKDYQTALAKEKDCEELLAQYTPLADALPQLGEDSIKELEAAAQTTAKDAVKKVERDSKPLDRGALPQYTFPNAVTEDMLSGGKSLGGTTGAKLIEVDGKRYIMKRGGNTSNAHLENEMLGNAAYRAAGIRAPDFRTYTLDGETVSLTQYVPDGKTLGDFLATASPAKREKALGQLREGFSLDALMGNWDVLGTGKDNVLVDADGNVWRIDNGSAFGFRAQGAKKGAEFWDKRTTIDDLWTMREASINRGVFDKLTTGQIMRDAKRIDFDAVMAALPPDHQKRLEKPLAELRSLIRETDDLDKGEHTDAHTSGVLDDIHELRKAGFQDRLAEIRAQFLKDNGDGAEVNQNNIPSLLRYPSSGQRSADVWDGKKYSSKITDAVISIKHHWEAGTDSPNGTKVDAALALMPDLEAYAKSGDKAAKELLPWLKQIEQSKADGYAKSKNPFPADTVYVPTGSVAKPKNWDATHAPAKSTVDASTMMRDFINGQSDSSGFEFIRKACSAQGSCSWGGDACKMKILAYKARGLEWDCTKVAVTTTDNGGSVSPDGALYGVGPSSYNSYEKCVKQYKADPESMERDAKAFRAMKAVTQTLFRDFPMAGKDGDDYLAVRIETKRDLVEKAADTDGFGMIATGSCESTGTFMSTYPACGQITVRRVPLSRLTASFVTTRNDSGDNLFASAAESETTVDLNGIPMWNGGIKKKSMSDLTDLRKRYLKAEKAWIDGGRKMKNQ